MTQQVKQAPRLGCGLSALLGDYAGARNAIEAVRAPKALLLRTMRGPEGAIPSEIAIDRIILEPQAAAPHLRGKRPAGAFGFDP